MANPQVEDGHTQIANEILEQLVRVHISSNQWQVIICIIRKTYGYHKKADYISNQQIIEATGLGKSVVSRALAHLESLNILTRNGKIIGLQKDYEQWKKLPKQATKVSSSANQKLAESATKVSNTANKQPEEKLAISSTELAISATKVSSCAVTQKIKETITKEIYTTPLPSFEKKQTVKEKSEAWETATPQPGAKNTPAARQPRKSDTTPYNDIIQLYQELCPRLLPMESLADLPEATRKGLKQRIAARWREKPDLNWWRLVLDRAGRSDFLAGQTSGVTFHASLGWLMLPEKLGLLLQGQYDNRNGGNHGTIGQSLPRGQPGNKPAGAFAGVQVIESGPENEP